MNLKSLIPIGRERGMARPEWSPFVNLQREIDRIFEEFARGLPSLGSSDLMPRMDVTESDGEIEITAELPGLEEKDVEITVSDNVLTVRGEKKAEAEEKKKDYRLVERSYGSFSRSVELPSGVDPDRIKATMTKGVLKITVPKPAPSHQKKIEVKAAA
ncbi:MAG: Hsp20/alpha crystallin family protein [Variibacter sp.]|nr:Hsp20/alpha crystallin family protein [Variibacter sp.]